MYGPSPQNVRGSLHILARYSPKAVPVEALPAALGLYAFLRGLVVGLPVGWASAERLAGHRRIGLGLVMAGLVVWALIHLRLPFAAQFLAMLSLTTGFLIGGWLATMASAASAPR